ncbi:Mo25-domain-containing protein [Mytilinidion resinicola]|uniref:Mo25-domain-containing protein n=1 Tax=Mytilinidion resinicola TaxID=574789 RepID=A0A6A6YHC5_9PEZI|nr:Mo25-domain-containing protein [Mytilinidion resinicola]KAF2807999.1 Mo25-domain-containing protein [Mytilinidion resinicola]
MTPPHDSIRETHILREAHSSHVLPLLETFQQPGGRLVLVFPFMPYDFDQALQKRMLSEQQIKGCLKNMFSALAHIHSQGIIHRDVKPSNILLKSLSGPAYLGDFGISWQDKAPASEPADKKITDVGTTCYRPPELLFGNCKYGSSLDLWAAGCTAAEAMNADHETLFDAGDLGSELALIQSIFKKLGTPNLTVWPEAEKFHDWGKMQFYEYEPQPWSKLVPGASETELNLTLEPRTSSTASSDTMAFFFRNKQKSSIELTRSTRELVQRLAAEEKPNPKTEEELARNLAQMKIMIQGTPEAEVSPEVQEALVREIESQDLIMLLADNIYKFPFESRKDTQVIFSTAFRYKPPGANAPEPPVLHNVIRYRPEVIISLCKGYDRRESAMPCGGVLREALKFDAIAALILYDEPTPDGKVRELSTIDPGVPSTGQGIFWRFFDWIDKGAFEVSADAFNTFRVVNFTLFFAKYNDVLVQSESYVTKRQSIKLLGEILLDRSNYNVMTTYVDSGDHLKIIMKLLRDDRRMINYEGFHVFKVFVANPNKSVAVQRILISNRDKLLRFLPTFLEDRTEDDQFTDEKSFLIRQIELMPSAPVASTVQAS